MDTRTKSYRSFAERATVHSQLQSALGSGTPTMIELQLAEELANQLAAFFEQKVDCQPLCQIASTGDAHDTNTSMLSIHFGDSTRSFDWNMKLSRSFARELLDMLFGLPSHLSRSDREERFSSFELRLMRRLAQVVARSVDRVVHGGPQSECLGVELGTTGESGVGDPSTTFFAGRSMSFQLTAKDRCGVVVILLPISSAQTLKAERKSSENFPFDVVQTEAHRFSDKTCLADSGKAILAVKISAATLRVREIADLKPGDVITTDTRYPSAIDVTINGSPKFTGILGASRNQKAVRITEIANR